MLIENLDHLLIAISLWHSHQASELTDAMIDMHHVVANLKLLDFLQRESHLTTTGLIALEVILMETVEYLMIGEDADTKIIVSKAFMKGLFDRGEDVPFGISPC